MTDLKDYSLQELKKIRADLTNDIVYLLENEPTNTYAVDSCRIERNEIDNEIWERTH